MYSHQSYSISDLFQISEETKKHIHEYAMESIFGYSEGEEPDEIRDMRERFEEGFKHGLVFALEYSLGEWE